MLTTDFNIKAFLCLWIFLFNRTLLRYYQWKENKLYYNSLVGMKKKRNIVTTKGS